MSQLGLAVTSRVRFCFFAAEEKGLKGSRYYVDQAIKSGEIANLAGPSLSLSVCVCVCVSRLCAI